MENKSVRDTMFRHYFNGGHGSGIPNMRLLSLVNAIQGADHTDLNLLKINTLDGSFFSSLKNDVSCTLNGIYLMLIEHQSTINYNMPLRFLSYLSKFYNKLTSAKATYNKERIPLPSPQFYVFYNGRESTEEISEMKLEDAFSDPNPVITLKVKAFDIRYERNSRLLHDCQEMMYYSIFVSKVEEYKTPEVTAEQAVLKAVNYCIEHDIMKEFMEEHRQEVVNMFTEEWNLEEAKRVAAEEAANKEAAEEAQKKAEQAADEANEAAEAANQKSASERAQDAAETAEEAAKEARNESKIEAIIEMLKDQLPVEKISKYTKFSVEQIEEIGARYALL